jgi:hypothetical protein
VSAVGARLQARVPTTKSAALDRTVRLRPKRSERRAPTSAPMTAPTKIPAEMTCCHPSPTLNSSLICKIAPEMMPVS